MPNIIQFAPTDAIVTQRDGLAEIATNILSCHEGNFDEVCDCLAKIKRFIKQVETYRKSITSQIDGMKKDIIAQERAFVRTVSQEAERLQAMSDEYATRLEMARREAERKAEEARREAIEAQLAQEANDPFGIATPSAPVLEPQVFVPERTRADSARVVMVTEIKVLNPNLVPREFLTVDESKIRSFIADRKKAGCSVENIHIDGVAIVERASVRSK